MKKVVVFFVFVAIVVSSCARMREARAAKHQPFKPHMDQKQKQKRHKR